MVKAESTSPPSSLSLSVSLSWRRDYVVGKDALRITRQGLLAFVSSVVIVKPTPPPSRLSPSLSLSAHIIMVLEAGLWFWQGRTAYNQTRPSQAFLSSVVIAEPTPAPPV